MYVSAIAASFVVNAATVVEGDSSAMVCATMVANPTAATLEKEVVVTLSTQDNTCKQIFPAQLNAS